MADVLLPSDRQRGAREAVVEQVEEHLLQEPASSP